MRTSRWLRFTLFLSLTLSLSASNNFPAPDSRPLPLDRGRAAVLRDFRQLQTIASALHVTAHPDDEDGGMLVLESRFQGVRMGLLTLTRGEGGQNVMSGDYFDALGVLRTRELLDSDRFYGLHSYNADETGGSAGAQLFSNLIDYGFSKTLKESVQKWTMQRGLEETVRAIRLFRPLVVIARFQGAPRDGHANHQYSGVVARQAFALAGDPHAFPQQLYEGLRPWQPRKLYAGNIAHNEPCNVRIDEDSADPTTGYRAIEIARLGWWSQLSQYGGGSIAKLGSYPSCYQRVSPQPSSNRESGFFQGINTKLTALAAWLPSNSPAKGNTTGASWLASSLTDVESRIATAQAQYFSGDSLQSAAKLAGALSQFRQLAARLRQLAQTSRGDANAKNAALDVAYELQIKQDECAQAIADVLGIEIHPIVMPAKLPAGPWARFQWPGTIQTVSPAQRFGVQVSVEASQPLEVSSVKLGSVHASRPQHWSVLPFPTESHHSAGNTQRWRFQVTAPKHLILTRPYWAPRTSVEQSWYQIPATPYRLRPFAPYPLFATVNVMVDGVTVPLRRVVLTSHHETGQGQVLNPLIAAPALSIRFPRRFRILPAASKHGVFTTAVIVRSNLPREIRTQVRLRLPPGWTASPAAAIITLDHNMPEKRLSFRVRATGFPDGGIQATVTCQSAPCQGETFTEGYRLVGYAGIRPYPFYRAARQMIEQIPVRVAPGLRVAYVMGSGDSVPDAIRQLGVQPVLLSPEALATANLNQFDEIMLGVRAYAARPDVRAYNARLLDYVHRGGVLIVQYNTWEFDHNYGPYPYSMGNAPAETDETAPVLILHPQNPLFTFPNKITESDFNNWVEQRGARFLVKWAPQYVPLLSTHDPGQTAQLGGLLFARYGKGIYVIQNYALYRELPQGVPGAYRMLANLLSLPKAPR